MDTLIKLILLLLVSISLYGANEKVSIQLQWLHQFQFGGFYAAKEMGFYDEVGLDVSIKEFNSTVVVVDEVVQNRSEFGVGRSSLLIDRSKGQPLIALGAIYQHSPSVLISTNKDIKSLDDLKNKNIMITENQARGASIKSMLLSQGLFVDDVNIQVHSFNLQDLIDGKTDAMACYISNEPYFLEEANVSYNVFNPKDYGFKFYGDILFTSEEQLKKYPKRTEDFYRASIKGWKWAFENVEKTASLIYNKYNTQNKSLESLIFEGNTLKKLALNKNGQIGFIDSEQLKKIHNIYSMTGHIKKPLDLNAFLDPLGFNKTTLNIGVLAKRGDDKTLQRWKPLAHYLNRVLEHYHVVIKPLHFDVIQESLKAKSIDFLLANTMHYVQLENKYGITRVATLEARGEDKGHLHNYFGGVLFTKKDSEIDSIEMVEDTKFAAVNENSFGGWLMVYELLYDNGLNKEDIDLTFYHTHDKVVYAVLEDEAEVGTVRSDTLEIMAAENKIDLNDIKILNPQHHLNFPYIVSTKLYPEWPFSKLQHISEEVATEMMMALITMPYDSKEAIASDIGGWTVPLDYSSVHAVLKKLKVSPYDNIEMGFIDFFQKYSLWFYSFIFLVFLGLLQYLSVRKVNAELDNKVDERTQALSKANKKLKVLAQKDSLTGINNRGYFLRLAEQFFNIAKRNNSPLQVLSLDIDYFKNINDTYGHQVGDVVLKLFCEHVNALVRKSDIFGRTGGEEFVICLQNTTHDQAVVFAHKVLKEVRSIVYKDDKGNEITFRVSIGIAELKDHNNFDALLNESDEALYKAKYSGRDCVRS